jgi:hypothetical protein
MRFASPIVHKAGCTRNRAAPPRDFGALGRTESDNTCWQHALLLQDQSERLALFGSKHSKHIETHEVATTILHSNKNEKAPRPPQRNKTLKCKHDSTHPRTQSKSRNTTTKSHGHPAKDETEQNWNSPEGYVGQAIHESIREDCKTT